MTFETSLRLRPAAFTRTSTCPWRGDGVGISASVRFARSPAASKRRAFISIGAGTRAFNQLGPSRDVGFDQPGQRRGGARGHLHAETLDALGEIRLAQDADDRAVQLFSDRGRQAARADDCKPGGRLEAWKAE